MTDLLVIVPTRGRPDNLRRVVEAWDATGAWDDAEMLVARDGDDPEADRYADLIRDRGLREMVFGAWLPMVDKLNRSAVAAANGGEWAPFALGFAGDDHLPRTPGWAARYLDELRKLGTGIVHGNDLVWHGRLPTEWAMTSDIVQALGRMVPADVQHLYCDNAIAVLGQAAGCIRYLPDVVVEHMHPVAGKADMDDGYRRVNSPERYRDDRVRFARWVAQQLNDDADKVRALREVASV